MRDNDLGHPIHTIFLGEHHQAIYVNNDLVYAKYLGNNVSLLSYIIVKKEEDKDRVTQLAASIEKYISKGT